jgi:hypothetical protein
LSTARKIFLPLEDEDGEVIAQVEAVQLLHDDEGELRLADPQGSAGISGYDAHQGGLPNNKDYNPEYRPALARGSYRNHGFYHQAWLENPSYQRAVRNIVEGLTTGFWHVEPYDDSEESALIAKQAQAVLFGLDGGWERHVEEALYMLISGFAIFIKVTDGFGQLRRLDFRFSQTVNGWVTDEQGNELVAVRFTDAGGKASDYVVSAPQLVLYQIGALGNDFEGVSPMRSVYKFIQANQLFSRLEALAAEKYGTPIAWVKRGAEAGADSKDDDVLVDILDQMVAADNPIIILPNGYEIIVSSPQGQMPNFDVPKRYCDEQITRILQADGALVGLNGTGAYSLAEVKDDQQIRSLFYYGSLICRVVNGEGARPYTGIIRHIVDALPASQAATYRGRYPRLRWSLAPQQDDGLQLDQIIQAAQAGVIELDDEDKALIRTKMGLPKRRALR